MADIKKINEELIGFKIKEFLDIDKFYDDIRTENQFKDLFSLLNGEDINKFILYLKKLITLQMLEQIRVKSLEIIKKEDGDYDYAIDILNLYNYSYYSYNSFIIYILEDLYITDNTLEMLKDDFFDLNDKIYNCCVFDWRDKIMTCVNYVINSIVVCKNNYSLKLLVLSYIEFYNDLFLSINNSSLFSKSKKEHLKKILNIIYDNLDDLN